MQQLTCWYSSVTHYLKVKTEVSVSVLSVYKLITIMKDVHCEEEENVGSCGKLNSVKLIDTELVALGVFPIANRASSSYVI